MQDAIAEELQGSATGLSSAMPRAQQRRKETRG